MPRDIGVSFLGRTKPVNADDITDMKQVPQQPGSVSNAVPSEHGWRNDVSAL